MILRELEIKNFRSLEHIELKNLNFFNVFIGRNNSGKSSIFNALLFLTESLGGKPTDWSSVHTDQDNRRSLEFRLLFELIEEERKKLISLIYKDSPFKDRIDIAYRSELFKTIEFNFAGFGTYLHLRSITTLAEDSQISYILMADLRQSPSEQLPSRITLLTDIGNKNQQLINKNLLDIFSSRNIGAFELLTNLFELKLPFKDSATDWVLNSLKNYLTNSFFFNIIRRSTAQPDSEETNKLSQDGANLAQVLHTLNSNYPVKFEAIKHFVKTAIPDIGTLQANIVGKQTIINFSYQGNIYKVRLHDMGSGVEQLLMVATALNVTDNNGAIFIEEPESHLHGSAQRFLIEQLANANRQIFLTTHSPVFINTSHPRNLYKVQLQDQRTIVGLANKVTDLSQVLEDIGIRNSDVLLSDAILFVEGPSDKTVLNLFSEKLGQSLEKNNITLAHMGGGQYAERSAPLRAEVLEQISMKEPIPCFFIVDRDERSDDEINRLQKKLGEKLHVLEKRELENYLLIPKAIKKALLSKHATELNIKNKVEECSEDEIKQLIFKATEKLQGLVLLKRVKSQFGSLREGLLSREATSELSSKYEAENLAELIRKEVDNIVAEHLSNNDLTKIVQEEREKSLKDWSNIDLQLSIAPGEEILQEVFHHFGSSYSKTKDSIRVANEIEAEDLPEELNTLFKRIIAMTQKQQLSSSDSLD